MKQNRPSNLAALSLLLATSPAIAVDQKLLPVADGYKGFYWADATSRRFGATYDEGAARGQRILMKFDVRSIGDAELRGATLYLFGGAGSTSVPVDTRVYHYNFNNWNDAADANIPTAYDSYCTFLAKKIISNRLTGDYIGTSEWHAFPIGGALPLIGRDRILSLAIRDHTYTEFSENSGISFVSRNSVTWDGSRGKEPYIIFNSWNPNGSFTGGSFSAATIPEDWNISTSGGSSANAIENPYEAEDYLVELVAGSPVSLEQFVDTRVEPFQIEFDYEFRSTEGTLQVSLANRDGETTVLGTLSAPDTLTGALQTNTILVDSPDLLSLENGKLSFIYDGPAGSSTWLDNIDFTNPPPGPVPELRIERADAWTIRVAWPDPSYGYDLEQSEDLVSWWPVFDTPSVIEGEKQLSIWAGSTAERYYRLRAQE